MAVQRIVFAVALAGGAAALATVKPIKPTSTICGIICVDGVNECGQPYGGCYDPCVEPAPTPLPCTPPYLSTWYPTPVPTPTSPTEILNCSSIIVCVDAINSCGIPFGGCIPDCKPWNLVTPPCPLDEITALPATPFPLIPASETPLIDPIPLTPAVQPLGPETPVPQSPIPQSPVVVGPISATPTGENPILVTPAVESPISVTPVVQSPISVTPASQTPTSQTPASQTPASESPILGVPILAGPVAEVAEVAEGSAPERPLPWIPDENSFW
ncbi:hypothetical protein GGI35DRAFT_487531 [Trichoderma velutinum]